MFEVIKSITKKPTGYYVASLVSLCLIFLPTIVLAQENIVLNHYAEQSKTFSGISSILYSFVIGVFGRMAAAAAWVLELVVIEYTVGFSEMFATSGIGSAVDTLWGIIRDIFNIALIFGLIYVGIKMVITSANSATKRNLVTLIIAAIFVNFSLFFAKLILDFSNLLATVIYNDLILGIFNGNNSITVAYYDALKLTTLFKATIDPDLTLTKELGFIFGTLILLLVTTIVFFAGAFLLFVRFVVVNIYLVFSPVMFLGMVFPNMKSVSDQYLNGYIKKCFVAPAYLFMVYLSLIVIVSLGQKEFPNANYAEGLTGTNDTVLTVFVFFIVASAFMIASVIVAQKLGAEGGNASMRVINNLGGYARRKTTQPARYVARNVSNKAGMEATRRFNHLQTREAKSWAGRKVTALARSSSVDETVRNATATASGAKFGLATTVQQNRDRKDRINSRVSTQEVLNAGMAAEAKRRTGVALSPDEEKVSAKMQAAVAKMTAKDFEERTQKEREAMAEFMNSNEFEKLMESEKVNNSDKNNLKAARTDAIKRLVYEVDAATGKFTDKVHTAALVKLTDNQLEMLGTEFINEHAHELSHKQTDGVMKSKSYTDGQKSSFISKRNSTIQDRIEKASSDPEGINRVFKVIEKNGEYTDRKVKDIAKLPSTALTHQNSAQFITPSVMEAIMNDKESDLTTADKKTIRTNIETLGTPEAKDWLKNSPKGRDFGK